MKGCVCDDPETYCGGTLDPDEAGYCRACAEQDGEAHCLICPYECCETEPTDPDVNGSAGGTIDATFVPGATALGAGPQ